MWGYCRNGGLVEEESSGINNAVNEEGKIAVKRAPKALWTKAVISTGSSIGTPVIIGIVITVFFLIVGMVMAFIEYLK